jgi:hypothetical protein
MKFQNILVSVTLIVATATITTTVLSQDKAKGHDHDKPGQGMPKMSPEEQAMMAKWQEYATPGENHKLLAFKEGKWTCAVKMWMDPNKPANESTATAEYKWMMDGRYLSDNTEGTFNGQPFHGHGLNGYDNLKKKFISFWIDNMGTGFMTAEGTYDPASKTFKFTGESPNLESGRYVKTRSEEKVIDNDHWTVSMYEPHSGDGKEFKSLELTYTRVK